jgi:hypothetical protein
MRTIALVYAIICSLITDGASRSLIVRSELHTMALNPLSRIGVSHWLHEHARHDGGRGKC